MGIWIRSQDKKKLVECKNIRFQFIKEKYNEDPDSILFAPACILGKWVIVTDPFDILGSYSTEEKAMAVMDMIQSNIIFIEQSNIGERFNTLETMETLSQILVFQMPQDEEV